MANLSTTVAETEHFMFVCSLDQLSNETGGSF